MFKISWNCVLKLPVNTSWQSIFLFDHHIIQVHHLTSLHIGLTLMWLPSFALFATLPSYEGLRTTVANSLCCMVFNYVCYMHNIRTLHYHHILSAAQHTYTTLPSYTISCTTYTTLPSYTITCTTYVHYTTIIYYHLHNVHYTTIIYYHLHNICTVHYHHILSPAQHMYTTLPSYTITCTTYLHYTTIIYYQLHNICTLHYHHILSPAQHTYTTLPSYTISCTTYVQYTITPVEQQL